MDSWFIVAVKPQCERKAVAEIRRAGYRAYLPKAALLRRHHRSKKDTIKRQPALVGYVFMRFPDGLPNFLALHKCTAVRGVLYCDGRPYELARQHVAAIMRAQRKMIYDQREARAERRGRITGDRHAVIKDRFAPGNRIFNRVTGVMALVTKVTNRGTIMALTEIMGRQTPVEFTDPDTLTVLAA